MNETYDDLIGKVCLALFKIHHEKGICYKLNDEAEELYKEIFDKYNGQFNLKYSGSSEQSLSQSQLDEKLEINVRMKGLELIGRLTSVLWIYCNGMNYFIYEIIYIVYKATSINK